MGDYGIKETKELIGAVLTLIEESHEAAKNGIGLDDIGKFFKVAKEFPAAFEGIGEVPEEIMDLDEAEYKEICDFIKEDFDISEDDVEAVVEQLFNIVIGMVRTYTMIKNIRSKKDNAVDG